MAEETEVVSTDSTDANGCVGNPTTGRTRRFRYPPGTDGDEKRSARKEYNRHSAAQSRQRRRDELEALRKRARELEEENARLRRLAEPPALDEIARAVAPPSVGPVSLRPTLGV